MVKRVAFPDSSYLNSDSPLFKKNGAFVYLFVFPNPGYPLLLLLYELLIHILLYELLLINLFLYSFFYYSQAWEYLVFSTFPWRFCWYFADVFKLLQQPLYMGIIFP